MKIDNKTTVSRMPKEIAMKLLPYSVIKILNGAKTIPHYQNKKDMACIEFDNEKEILNISDYLNCRLVADSIYKEWVEAKSLESSYQTLGNTLKIHRLAQEKLERIYEQKFDGKKKVLFVKGDDYGCGYWRMVLPARYLKEDEYVIDVSKIEVIYEYLLSYDTIFIQRSCTWEAYYVIEKLKKAGKKIIYDIDDNMFDLPDHNPARKFFKTDELHSAIKIMRIVDTIVTTTDNMKEYLVQYVGDEVRDKIIVIPNAINLDDYPAKDIYPVRSEAEDKPFRIVWAGSATHEYDFLLIMEALDKFLLNHKDDNVRILILGYLPLCVRRKSQEPHWQGKIEFVDFQNIETYFSMIDKVYADVGIAPLEDNAFNRGKSNIKWQEYMLSGTPTFASNIPPYSKTIENGVDGLLLNNTNEWLEALEDKYNTREDNKWQKIVDNARKKVENQYNIAKVIEQWKEIFES